MQRPTTAFASCFRPASRNRNPLTRLFQAITLLFVLTLASLTAGAQATQGSVIGTVKDSKGAVVPNASVTLINLDEGVSRTTKTSSTGTYAFLDSKAARYTLRVEAPGFEVSETAGVTLQVRQELRLDATLSVGSVQQSVTVNGDSVSAIQTDSPTISATFTQDDANSLPVNTRASFSGTSAAGILSTLPGAQGDSSGVSLQGALPYQVDVTVDGITLKNAGGGTFIGDSFPSTEAISEIRTDSVMANAEYGDPGQVIVTTKGGSNLFHGSAFTYYQDSKWNAIAYTYPITTSQPPVHGATFGGSLGGPVVFPHLYNGHNKSFFFVDYEGWRHPAKTLLQEVVPSTLMKQGDFSKYVVPDGKGGNAFTGLTDPYTQTSWGTAVPSGNINTIAMNTLSQFYPDPNIGDPTAYTDNGVANWEQQVDISAHSNQFDVRGDQYFGANQKFLIWGKFTYKNFPGLSTKPLLVPSEQNLNNNKVLRVDTNWTIAPSLINEGGFGFTRVNNGSTNSFDGNAWTVSQGWQGLQNLFYNGIPEMDFNHIQSLDADRLTSVGNSLTYVYNDTLLWSKKNHTFKFGIDIQTLEAASALGFNGSDNYGTYNFTNGSASTGGFTGVDFADFLTGIPDATFYDVVKQDNDGVSAHYHVFAQDDWRVTPNLTISYGVRYELHPGYHDKGGDIGNFDPTVAGSGRAIYPDGKSALLAQAFLASANACDPDGVNNTNNATVNGAACMPVETASQAGFPTGLKKYPHLRFMPRIGLAYRPFHNDRTALRAGYGIYNINMLGSSFYSLTGTLQAQTQQFNNGLNCGDSGCTPYWQWPTVYSGTGSAAGVGGYGTAYFGTANSINWKDPYTEQWSASIDRDLGKGYALRLSYIGSETHDLVWAPDENTLPYSSTVSAYDQPQSARLFPNWGRINTRDTGANQSYNSMQIDATHRMQHGLEYHSTFTWAKSLADNEGPANTGFAGEGGGSRATSILNRHVDFGNVYGTRRIRWNTTALYDLPFGRGKMFGGSMPRVADLIVGGWRLSSILTVQTGPYLMPYFPSGQGDPSGTGSGLTSSAAGWDPGHRNQAPDRVAGVSNKPRGQNRFNWTNAAAYTCPGDPNWFAGNACVTGNSGNTVTYEDKKYVGYEVLNGVLYKVPNPIGRFGNSGVGTVEGPGLVNLSSGLSKSFAITEHMHLKAEGTFTNVLNHTNLGDPNMDLSSASFGLITGTIGSDFGGARTAQIAARLEF